jgi:hypothetical protein
MPDINDYPHMNQFALFVYNNLHNYGPLAINGGDYSIADFITEEPITGTEYTGSVLSTLSNIEDFITAIPTGTSSNYQNTFFTPGVYIFNNAVSSGQPTTFGLNDQSNPGGQFIFVANESFDVTNLTFVFVSSIEAKNVIFHFKKGASLNIAGFKGILISSSTQDPMYLLEGGNYSDCKVFSTQALVYTHKISLPSSSNLITIDGSSMCFAEGTRVLTPNGEVLVEDLKVGDEVVIRGKIIQNSDFVESPAETKKIIWTGNYSVHTSTDDKAPIRIEKGALGNDLPTEDLYVSANHGIVVDGKLVPAHSLKNGSTIGHDRSRENIRYYHFEVDEHAAVVAHGVLCESFLDTGDRSTFTTLSRGPIN